MNDAAPQTESQPQPAPSRVSPFKGRAPKITAANVTLAEQSFSQFHAKPEAGVPLEQVLRPEFWAHVSAQFKPLALIHVNAADGSYYALLQVRSCSRIEAVCEVLLQKEFGPVTRLAQTEGKEFVTRWGSPAVGWQVIRAADKQVVKDGFMDEATAQHWLDEHLKALAA